MLTTASSPDVLRHLQSLVALNIDSAKGFSVAAEVIKNARIAAFFRECADGRDAQAAQLQAALAATGESPTNDGSAIGTMHRWWLNLRGTIADGEEHAVLAEAERGEDSIKKEYEKALTAASGQQMHAMLLHQYAAVKNTHDHVRDMRDAAAKK